MESTRPAGRTIGLLLLVQLVAGLILPYVLLLPVSTPAGAFLDTAAGMAAIVRLSVLILFVGGAASVAVAVLLWPLARERHHGLGLWLLAAAVTNFTLQLVENAQWLSLLSLSEAFVAAGEPSAGIYRELGVAAYASFRWAHYSHILIAVSWLFMLYWLFHRAALLPRSLALAGMGAALLHFIGIILPAFAGYRMPAPELFGAPLALATLVASLRLLARKAPPAEPSGQSVRVKKRVKGVSA